MYFLKQQGNDNHKTQDSAYLWNGWGSEGHSHKWVHGRAFAQAYVWNVHDTHMEISLIKKEFYAAASN